MDTVRRKLNILVAIDAVPDKLWERLQVMAQVRFATDGYEAYRALASEQFDVVFLDLNLRGIDSFELLRRTRAEELCMAVVLTSESPSFSYAQQGILYGVSAYLLRPLELSEVEDVIIKIESNSGPKDRRLTEAARQSADSLREKSAPGIFLHIGDELCSSLRSDVDRRIRFCDYYSAVVDIAFQQWPWLKLYHHREEYVAHYCMEEFDEEMVKNICLRNFQQMNRDIMELFPRSEGRSMDDILTYLLKSVDENVQQKDVAERYFITNSTLSARFQRNLGMSYREYMTAVKLQRGQYLLLHTDIKPEELAARLGYKDREYFSKLFLRRTGQTVWEYGRTKCDEYDM